MNRTYTIIIGSILIAGMGIAQGAAKSSLSSSSRASLSSSSSSGLSTSSSSSSSSSTRALATARVAQKQLSFPKIPNFPSALMHLILTYHIPPELLHKVRWTVSPLEPAYPFQSFCLYSPDHTQALTIEGNLECGGYDLVQLTLPTAEKPCYERHVVKKLDNDFAQIFRNLRFGDSLIRLETTRATLRLFSYIHHKAHFNVQYRGKQREDDDNFVHKIQDLFSGSRQESLPVKLSLDNEFFIDEYFPINDRILCVSINRNPSKGLGSNAIALADSDNNTILRILMQEENPHIRLIPTYHTTTNRLFITPHISDPTKPDSFTKAGQAFVWKSELTLDTVRLLCDYEVTPKKLSSSSSSSSSSRLMAPAFEYREIEEVPVEGEESKEQKDVTK
jgi:hypothetical protein